jgi:hypothetical protein
VTGVLSRPPDIAVIVATIEPWPTIRPCLDRLLPQIARAGGELIVADGTPDGLGAPPPHLDAYRPIATIAHPRVSVMALRARAAEASSAPLVAFTEDHCVVGERWVQQIVEAHAAHPDADMIAGPVTNGSTDGLVDWANFLMTFADFLPAVVERPVYRTPPMSNASFHRRVLMDGPLPEGWLELVMAPTVFREGRMHYDADVIVSHVQPRRLAQATVIHFHNGRACAGLALTHLAARDWRARLGRVPVLPWFLWTSVLRSLEGRTIPTRARLSLPVVFILGAAHAAGELVGLLRGEGQSAVKLN